MPINTQGKNLGMNRLLESTIRLSIGKNEILKRPNFLSTRKEITPYKYKNKKIRETVNAKLVRLNGEEKNSIKRLKKLLASLLRDIKEREVLKVK